MEGSRGACWRSGPTYRIECTNCLEDGVVGSYTGESGYTAYTRAELHQSGLKAGDPRSALWEHAARLHGARDGEGQQQLNSYKMKVVANYKSSSRRLIAEAILIDQELQAKKESDKIKPGSRVILNSKAQWYQPSLVRMQASAEVNY